MAGQIRDCMTERVVSVRYDESIATAVERLTQFGFSALPVVTDTSRLVGVVSLLDVLRYREAHAAEGAQADESVPVEEIMNPDVVSMQATANLAVVANRLRSNGQLRVLPIVRGGRLVGVVTRSDLLRHQRDDARRGGLRRWLGLRVVRRRRDRADEDALFALARQRHRGPSPVAATPIEDVMTRDVVTASRGDTVALAAELMMRHRHTALPVVDGQATLLGIVSEADVLAALTAGASASMTVGQVMTREPVVVRSGTTVGAARTLVADRGLRTVPVLDGDRLVGVLSRSDLL